MSINIVLTSIVFVGFIICVVFFLYFLISKQNYMNEVANQGMAPSIGLGITFKPNELQELSTKLAIETYSKEVVDSNPNLIESVRATILGKYSLFADTYWYNDVNRDYILNNNFFYLLIPIALCISALVANIIVLVSQIKEHNSCKTK